MELYLDNIGIIKDSKILLDGLTVITGKNRGDIICRRGYGSDRQDFADFGSGYQRYYRGIRKAFGDV